MQVRKVFAGVLVSDLTAATEWYSRAFGRPHDSAPMSEVVEWQLLEQGWVQVVHDEERAGHSSIAVVVESLADQVAALESAGISTGEVQGTPGFAKTSTVTDPDGNWVTFVEDLSGS